MSKVLQQCLTAPSVAPEGSGWECIHSGCSPDGTRWWLWQRFVSEGARVVTRSSDREGIAGGAPSAVEGTAIPSSESEAERFALECEAAQPLQLTQDAAEAMAARASFYWALAANWEGR